MRAQRNQLSRISRRNYQNKQHSHSRVVLGRNAITGSIRTSKFKEVVETSHRGTGISARHRRRSSTVVRRAVSPSFYHERGRRNTANGTTSRSRAVRNATQRCRRPFRSVFRSSSAGCRPDVESCRLKAERRTYERNQNGY